MNIKFIEKDHISQEACTNFWFTVDKSEWALSVDVEGEVTLLDSDGCPVSACNDHNDLKGKLMSQHEFSARSK